MNRFPHFFIAGLVISFLAHAQIHSLDQAVLTELTRGTSSPLAVNALQSNPELQRRYTAGVLEQELAQEAARRGLAERLDVQQALAGARMQILIQALQADISRKLPRPTDAEVEREFRTNAEAYQILEAVKADIFLLDGSHPESLNVARRAVSANEIDGAELQKIRFQQIALAEQGVWVARDVFPEDIWTAVKQIPAGRVRFFRVEDNVLLLKFYEHREARAATLDEVREQIRQELTQRRFQEAWQNFLQEKSRDLGLSAE